ncbi:hypothetical protein BT246_29300 [Bacillus thuringiensis]|uniref:Uncharacterized protein n=1 Tax=Bacillus thuringiensis TaxID=1428 RepID=A0A9W3SCY3_BACTU|nr:hypothetical protein BT246_29300 [Bacillus thuringiensis]
MNYKQQLLDNFAFKTSYIAQFVPGMSIKKRKIILLLIVDYLPIHLISSLY